MTNQATEETTSHIWMVEFHQSTDCLRQKSTRWLVVALGLIHAAYFDSGPVTIN
ncbi:hypothetical protein HanRHA438_Chr15g0684481 [Helianthus annuus]|nr:hypothetical protein HanRHA438_Chr15g0684481 [Helianthus annuus]